MPVFWIIAAVCLEGTMWKFVFGVAVLVLVSPMTVRADQYVNGYFKSDGTYVQGHYRSNSDGYGYNNYSAKGNVNPYTGQRGYSDPYKMPEPSYGNHGRWNGGVNNFSGRRW